MNLTGTRFIDLTFINDSEEVKKHIRNTILFLYLAEKYGLSVLSDYIVGTQYGYTASAKTGGNFRLLRITDITEGKVDWESVPYCDCDKPTNYLLKQDDILVARTGGTTGKSFIVKEVPSNVVFASYLIRLRMKNENNPEFVSAYLNSYTYWSQLVELKRGAAQPNVNAEKLKKIVIPNCSPDIQDRYVSYLNGGFNDVVLDSRIIEVLSLFDGNQALQGEHIYQLDLLKKLRKQILQDAVEGKLVPQDPNDEPADELLERIKMEREKLIREKKISKEKPLPEIKLEEIPFEIPGSWHWVRIGEISQHNSGKTLDGGRNSGRPRKCLTTSNLYWGYFETDNLKTILIEDEELERCTAKKGDLLICEGGDAGRAAIWDSNTSVCFQNHLHRVRFYENINTSFGYWYFLHLSLCGRIENYRKGMGISNLSGKSLSMIVIPLVPIEEQHRIVTRIEKLMKLCDELEQNIQLNQRYTQDLLQVALKEALEYK